MNFNLRQSVANSVKRNLNFYESTPLSNSRKRKSELDCGSDRGDCSSGKLRDALSCTMDSSLLFSPDIMTGSSPRDEARLSSSFERISLSETVEPAVSTAKRARHHSPPEAILQRKSNSAPGTPLHTCTFDTPLDDEQIKKFHSLDFTPRKWKGYIKNSTPECNKILYPSLIERKPASKPKSPQKLREELRRSKKPAKKRLFIIRDFVYLFTKSSNNMEIVKKIFSYLSDSDLASVGQVSKLWNETLRTDRMLYLRCKSHTAKLIRSKENVHREDVVATVATVEKENWSWSVATSLAYSPAKSNWHKYMKFGANLECDQQLIKCSLCSDPAVLQRNIAQCTRHHCQYIWCVRCQSGSHRGPEHFICKCEKGTTPPRPASALCDTSLYDISNSCSFLSDSTSGGSFASLSSFSLVHDTSSGYYTHSEEDKSFTNGTPAGQRRMSAALSDCNRRSVANTGTGKGSGAAVGSDRSRSGGNRSRSGGDRSRSGGDRSGVMPYRTVAEQCMQRKVRHRPRSPGSPASPNACTTTVVGSSKSKKSLRRLFL